MGVLFWLVVLCWVVECLSFQFCFFSSRLLCLRFVTEVESESHPEVLKLGKFRVSIFRSAWSWETVRRPKYCRTVVFCPPFPPFIISRRTAHAVRSRTIQVAPVASPSSSSCHSFLPVRPSSCLPTTGLVAHLGGVLGRGATDLGQGRLRPTLLPFWPHRLAPHGFRTCVNVIHCFPLYLLIDFLI